jgi:hypothetical protein
MREMEHLVEKNSRENLSTWRKPASVPLYPPKIPHELGLNPGRHGDRLATKYLGWAFHSSGD